MIIRYLTDIVSKGGNMLLNVAPNGQGAFPKQTFPIIKELHTWMQMNGEAIYGTRPWRIYGEKMNPNQPDEEIKAEFDDAVFNGFPQQRIPDVRYTSKGNKSERQDVNWKLGEDGLMIRMGELVDSYPIYVLEVSLKNS